MPRPLLPVVAISTIIFITTSTGASAIPDFQLLGYLPGGDSSGAVTISADGSTVVGIANSSSGVQPFRWTASEGMAGLGSLNNPGFLGIARAVSADGSIVYGESDGAGFRWTQSTGMVGIGIGPVFGTSADGSVAVGTDSGNAYRWTEAGGLVGLGNLHGASFGSSATATSADGVVVVGSSDGEAFHWTEATGMVGLGDLPGGDIGSGAEDISSDGTVVVGTSRSGLGNEAFMWSTAEGMIGLGDLPGGSFDSRAISTSSDGSVVVGSATTAAGLEAFIWTTENGVQSLHDLVVNDYGYDLGGIRLEAAHGISDDGQTIVGYAATTGGTSEAWILTIPEPSVVFVLVAGGVGLVRRRRG